MNDAPSTKREQGEGMNKREQLKLATVLFCVQVFSYCVITYNYRMIAEARVAEALMSDFIFGSANFFVIKRVANSADSFIPWLGYALGGVLGTYIGIVISRVFVVA